MARSKSRFAIQAEYYPLRTLLALLQALPYRWSKPVCRRLLHAVMALVQKRRQLMLGQLAASFPDRTPGQIASLARECVDHLGDGIATFARIPLMTDREIDGMVEMEGSEYMEEAYRKGKGVISFTAHYGCWEMLAIYVMRHFPRVSILVRPLDNPRLDALIKRIRETVGGGVIDSRRAFKDGLRHLRRNGQLGVLVDQNFYKGGVFVNFFGRPAATSTLVPILARRTGCVILPVRNLWRGGKIRIIAEPAMVLSSNPDINQAILEDTQQMTSVIERWVRDDPAQWLWLHHRWKRVPLPNEPVYSASA